MKDIMVKCDTVTVSYPEGSESIPSFNAPAAVKVGDDFSVDYEVCCDGGKCPYTLQIYMNGSVVHSEEVELINSCHSGSISVTAESDGNYQLELVYGDRRSSRSIVVEQEEASHPEDGDGGGAEPEPEPEPGGGSGGQGEDGKWLTRKKMALGGIAGAGVAAYMRGNND